MSDTAPALPRACQLVEKAARDNGIGISIRVMAESTRTAEEAAAACATTVERIVKSLVFQGKDSGKAILLLVSGANRVKENAVGRLIGEKIVRPDAAFVRETTGFAIGGIPPFGHASPIETWMDEDLLQYETVFAAAGTPTSIFEIAPGDLLRATGARTLSVTGE